MLENYFEATFTIQRLRTGLSGPYIDGFAEMLEKERYSFGIGRRYLRAAAHLGHYLETRGIGLDAVVFDVLEAFAQHLPSCCCPQSNGGTTEDVARGAKLFLKYLRVSRGLAIAELEKNKALVPELVQDFRHWLKNQRGLSESSLRTYGNGAAELIHSLGSDPDTYDAPSLRGFLIDHSRTVGPGKAKNLVNALRMFLRYLIHEGRCRAGLDRAIPALAGWRHAALPSYLSACEVRQTIEACDDGSVMGVRDKAIIVLLTRLGLRAGDVHALCLSKIDWEDGSFLVSGKTPQEVRLPLPQEVGDALVAYLKCRPRVMEDRVFLRILAPFRPFAYSSTISQIVTRRMRRAGIVKARYGAHILRHTTATEMLRNGVALHEIGKLLRHRSLDMTAHYAKVDFGLLQQVAQPWPEVL